MAGGLITLSKGSFNLAAQVSVAKNDIHIKGQGRKATQLICTVANMNGVVFGSGGVPGCEFVSLRGVTIGASVAKNAGAAVLIDGVSEPIIDDFHIDSHFNGVVVQGAAASSGGVHLSRGRIAATVPATGSSIIIKDFSDLIYLDRVTCAQDLGAGQPLYGLYVVNASAIQMVSCEFVQQGTGLFLSPTNGLNLVHSSFVDSYFDNCTNGGIGIAPAGGGYVGGLLFTACWMASAGAGGQGIYTAGAGTIDGVAMVNCRSLLNVNHGFVFTNGSNIFLDACMAYGNSAPPSVAGTSHGIFFNNPATAFAVRNCRSGPMDNVANTQGWGLTIGAGPNNYVVTGNNLRGNAVGALNDLGGPNKTVANNLLL